MVLECSAIGEQMPAVQSTPAARAAHHDSVFAGRSTSIDPGTGFVVFTGAAPAACGHGRGSGCRHWAKARHERRQRGRTGCGPHDTR